MIFLISHRGNINGKINELENNPNYVDKALRLGYDVEIDIWVIEGQIFLGHDEPQYQVSIDWLYKRKNELWIHCKNIESIEYFNKLMGTYNYFWHQEDTVTLTSKNFIWAYPGKQPIKNSISVLPELFNDDVSNTIGICSDYIEKYKSI
jgi:hypothetical protein